jgi:serine/threonine-protein phosphatase 2A regulatory subunit A
MSWLGDSVFSIREAATLNLKKLTEVFGVQWSNSQLIPKILIMSKHSNYLYRITTIFALTTLAKAFTPELIQTSILPTLITLSSDPIPNIRFNVARSFEIVLPLLNNSKFINEVKTSLNKMKDDQDLDVKYFAAKALVEVK